MIQPLSHRIWCISLTTILSTLVMCAPLHAKTPNQDEFIAELNLLITRDPGDTRNYAKRAIAYLQIKNFKGALIDANRALTLDPDDPILYRCRGDIYTALGEFDKALSDYALTLKKSEGMMSDVHKQTAICYQKLGRNELAKREHELYLRSESRTQGRFLEFETKYKRKRQGLDIQQSSPEDLKVLYGQLSKKSRLVFEEMKKKFPEQAKTVAFRVARCTRILEKCPVDRPALYARYYYLLVVREYTGAIRDISKLLAVDPKNKQAGYIAVGPDELLFRRARLFREVHRYADAIADYNEIVKLDPDSEEAYRYRGDCYAEVKEWGAAIADYSRAISMDRESSGSTYYARSLVYRKFGRLNDADRDLAQSKKLGYVYQKPSSP